MERTTDAGTEGRMERSVEEFFETWNVVQISGKINGTKETEFTLRLPECVDFKISVKNDIGTHGTVHTFLTLCSRKRRFTVASVPICLVDTTSVILTWTT